MPQRMLGFLHMRAASSLNVLALFASIILLAPGVALAGSQTYATPGTNGDAWTGNSSSGKTSKPIQMQTTYYLHCDGYVGSSPAAIDKQVSINIIPRFNEQ